MSLLIRARNYKTSEIVEIVERNKEMLEIASIKDRVNIRNYNDEYDHKKWFAQEDLNKVCVRLLKDIEKYKDRNGFISIVYIKSLIRARIMK